MPISKYFENKPKTTIVVLEKGNITLENATVSLEFANEMIIEKDKKVARTGNKEQRTRGRKA
jgi:hypothetical protein